MQIGNKKITLRMSAAYVAKLALLTAIAFALYLAKFNLPMMFPSFLEIQFSELPALLAGFSMGPVAGVLVVVLKCLLKMPLTSTNFVGELTDILIGIALVLPASLIYLKHKDKKHAAIGLAVGTLCEIVFAIIINRFISIPFYTELYFGGNFGAIINTCKVIYPNANEQNFYAFYLGLGIVPFNALRCILMALLTFLLYKRLSKILHWEGSSLVHHLSGSYECDSVDETYAVAEKIAATLKGGETILLSGELGAGKTTFTKGLAAALGVEEEVTSPTFTVLNVYEDGRLPFYHLDMYRMESGDELGELGIEDTTPENAVKVVEWNKFENLTGRIIDVKITVAGENERVFEVSDSAEHKKKEKPRKFSVKADGKAV